MQAECWQESEGRTVLAGVRAGWGIRKFNTQQENSMVCFVQVLMLHRELRNDPVTYELHGAMINPSCLSYRISNSVRQRKKQRKEN